MPFGQNILGCFQGRWNGALSFSRSGSELLSYRLPSAWKSSLLRSTSASKRGVETNSSVNESLVRAEQRAEKLQHLTHVNDDEQQDGARTLDEELLPVLGL